jgi:hypothetical protein
MLVHVVEFEVFMAATMKNAIFWDVAPCGSCENPTGAKYGLTSQMTAFFLFMLLQHRLNQVRNL